MTGIDLTMDDRGIAELLLNRPERRNAIDAGLSKSLLTAVETLSGMSPSCIVLRATGPHFSVGGDLVAMMESEDTATYITRLAACTHSALKLLRAQAAPIIVAVQGVVAGGGLGLAAAGDIVLAGSGSTFTSAYTRLGISPDCGVTQTLTRRVGASQALELILSNRTINAQEAANLGLVNRVVPDAELESETRDLAEAIAMNPAAASRSKQLVLSSTGSTYDSQLDAELGAIADLARTDVIDATAAAFLQQAASR